MSLALSVLLSLEVASVFLAWIPEKLGRVIPGDVIKARRGRSVYGQHRAGEE